MTERELTRLAWYHRRRGVTTLKRYAQQEG